MKKTAIITAILASVAFAGEELIPPPAPAPIPAPPAPAATPAATSLEIAGAYNFATRNILKDMAPDWKSKVDTIGVDLTGVYSLNANNAVTLRFGYAYGDDKLSDEGFSETYTLNTFYLMPGYRYTTSIADGLNFFAGANVGLINHSLKDKVRYEPTEFAFADNTHASAWGVAYSAEIGLTCDLCENTYLLVAYQLSGSSAKPKLGETPATNTARKQYYQSIRAGIGFKF